MRQSPNALSPFGPYPLGTAGRLEAALAEVEAVVALLSALAATAVQFDPHALYPAVDHLRRAHQDAAAVVDLMFPAAEVSA